MIQAHRDLLEALWKAGPILLGNEEALETWADEHGRRVALKLDERPLSERFPEAWPWLRPMDLGGHDSSDHGVQLARLVRKGWAERKRRDPESVRPSFLYRITAPGRDALFNVRALEAAAKAAEAAEAETC